MPVAAGAKRGLTDDKVVIDRIVGDVAGKDVIVLDDEIATAGSLVELFDKLREVGVNSISAACMHGLFTGPADRTTERPGGPGGDRLHQHRPAADGRRAWTG